MQVSSAASDLQIVSAEELAKHNQPGDLWLVIDGEVYNVSKFAKVHPGGAKVLEQLGGLDVTSEFYDLHRKDVLGKYKRLRVGRYMPSAQAPTTVEDRVAAISGVPFAEIPAFQGQESPFFNETHRAFRDGVRKFVQTELEPVAAQIDLSGEYPDRQLQSKLGMNGLLVTRMGP
eukprot:2347251-Amphidinium_carterae.2